MNFKNNQKEEEEALSAVEITKKQLGQEEQNSSSSNPLHTFIVYINIGFCIFIVLSFLYFHFNWRNGRNRLPDRLRFSQSSTFWNELNHQNSPTNNNRRFREDEDEEKLLKISTKLIKNKSSSSESSGEDL